MLRVKITAKMNSEPPIVAFLKLILWKKFHSSHTSIQAQKDKKKDIC